MLQISVPRARTEPVFLGHRLKDREFSVYPTGSVMSLRSRLKFRNFFHPTGSLMSLRSRMKFHNFCYPVGSVMSLKTRLKFHNFMSTLLALWCRWGQRWSSIILCLPCWLCDVVKVKAKVPSLLNYLLSEACLPDHRSWQFLISQLTAVLIIDWRTRPLQLRRYRSSIWEDYIRLVRLETKG